MHKRCSDWSLYDVIQLGSICFFPRLASIYLVIMFWRHSVPFHLQGRSTEIKCECLDILCDVLNRFGNLVTKDHEEMLSALLSQLSSNQASVRKKSISCIGKVI